MLRGYHFGQCPILCPTFPLAFRPMPSPTLSSTPPLTLQGWFISSFERQGQWVAGGGYVPLSHAICCRPCLPGELPPDPSGRIPGGAKPLAIISLGCHSSTDVLSTRCELEAGSFVSGYSEAVKVFTTVRGERWWRQLWLRVVHLWLCRYVVACQW